ncbi:MAG: LPS export ABC transporter periplasmic protein LptC [Bacteroidota bacterium]
MPNKNNVFPYFTDTPRMYYYGIKRTITAGIAIIACLLFFSVTSCKNSLEDVNSLPVRDTAPMETGTNMEVIYSDSAQIKALMKAPLYKRYEGENPYFEMPRGLTVFFYDSLMQVKTKLTARYAIKYDKKNVMEVRNDVVVVNQKGERLNTEHLVWDEKTRRIYSDVFVKITESDKVVYGEGLDAPESFERWTIKKPKGSFYIKTDDMEK